MARFCVLVAAVLVVPARAADPDFRRDVQPILTRTCISCHGSEKQKGGLRLDRKTTALAGGENGPVITPGKAADSPLIRRVSSTDPTHRMPPKGEPLSADEVNTLRAWIDAGARWPAEEAADARTDWWSLKPMRKPAVPNLSDDTRRVRNPIDAFVLAKLREKGLRPSPEADRRTLIRRLSFDLIGLPPTPDEVDAFLKDPDRRAYEKLVDRLLDSPHYGERWARHWLDVVHYGDTHGYDKDKPRPNAWRYRDYVIRSFNADKPYSRFVQEQVAGDVLYAGILDGIEALGFIAAGPWDFIGHVELPESKIDGKVARHLDRDDMVSNTIGTFMSLTVHCAQCHNHKFDPIAQEDYYRLQAVFAALDRTDRAYDVDPGVARRRAEFEARRKQIEAHRKELDAQVAKLGGKELAELEAKIATAGKFDSTTVRPEFGYHSGIERTSDQVKWVQVDLGKSLAIESVVLTGCHDDFNNIGAGFGFPVQFKVEAADDPEFKKDVRVIADHTAADYANPGTSPQTILTRGATARYVRVTATRLAPRMNDYIFALAELEAVSDGKNVARDAAVTAPDSIEAPVRWRKSNLTDGIVHPTARAKREVEQLRQERQAVVDRVATPELKQGMLDADASLAEIKRELAKLPPPRLAYVGAVHHGDGNFLGTGPRGGKPREIAVLSRGDVTRPGKPVGPGPIRTIPGLSPEFDLPATHSEGDRRAALAKWIASPSNPLTWRSIVNRVWLYHFGRGIVDTPNDFGRMGQTPTHPELLDWLAAEFREGQSMKALHRLIVTSATYRQVAFDDPAMTKIDSGNAYLWRMSRRRLEAEAIRDSFLSVAGKLDRGLYGPGFQDFVIDKPEHSPHYEYHLHDPEDPKTHRRSVYRFIVRSQLQPFMATLDCADPSLMVDKRNQTISPLQALALLNNKLCVAMAGHFAARVEKLANDLPGQVTAAYRLALGRSPEKVELDDLVSYARRHGLANACRVIMNLNEFVFVD